MPHPAATPAELGTDDELPEGWVAAALPAVFKLNPPKAKGADYSDDLPVTFVPMPAVDALTGTIRTPSVRSFGEVKKGFTSFRDGDVILAKITPCMENGKAAVVGGMLNGLGFGSTEFHVFRPTGAVLPEYLFHFLRQESFRRNAADEMTGSVGQKRVPAEFLTGVELPVPPLAEQWRIVTGVGRVLDKVSSARARLDRVPTTLKRFRQAVLAAACSGQLTADWRDTTPDVRPASDLLSLLARNRSLPPPIAFSDKNLPLNWAKTTLGYLTDWGTKHRPFITSGSRGWANYVGASGRYFIRSENINTEYLRLVEDVRVDVPEGSETERTRVRGGDLLLTITGNNVGRTAVVPDDCPPAHVSQHVAIIRVDRTLCVNYVWLWLRSDQHGNMGLEHYGETKPGLNLEQVRELVVHLPPLAEQQEIIRRVSALFAHADAIESRTAAARKRVDALTQAVLAKAFRGELVPTEAELARRDGRPYEPAADLLARLRATAGPVTKVTRGRKSKGSSRS